MAKTRSSASFCAQCTRAQLRPAAQARITPRRWQTTKSAGPSAAATTKRDDDEHHSIASDAAARIAALDLSSGTVDSRTTSSSSPPREPGAMSQRLQEATEEALLTGGRAGRKAIEDAGFSNELKERLFARVQDAKFRAENAGAFAEAGMPGSADRRTYADSTSSIWTGTETTEGAVLRMLNDAHKPLRGAGGKPRFPDLKPVDLRIRAVPQPSAGQRLANARERASVYTDLGMKDKKDKNLTDDEREARRAEFRERFKPAGRTMPATLTGLAHLANERIEDAIARGQFKNIPRGPGIERDTRADNPFIDTTEYIMNKMIKQQNIVPPWIDKQQELIKAVHVFRSRMRNDWRRHAARSIASRGGSLEEQVRTARRYALAEEIHNPVAIKKVKFDEGADSAPTVDIVTPLTMLNVQQQLSTELSEETSSPNEAAKTSADQAAKSAPLEDEEEIMPLSAPFRDPAWLALEKTYMELSIANINSIARAYNLMAPELAKKPYYSLERELNRCYAEIAPQLAETILERASRPAKKAAAKGTAKPPGILDRFGTPTTSRVYDSKEPHYGFKEMWRDLFKGGEATK